MTTPLAARLTQRIGATGPITLAEFMAEALGHPQHGYYVKQRSQSDPFGSAGDFITAPEISQVFGELLGLWILDFWQRSTISGPLQLVELGPGRGSLMRDILRVLARYPEMTTDLTVHLVEISPALRAGQKNRLSKGNVRLAWYDHLNEVPEAPFILIANEFLDALPVRQFHRQKDGWHEVMVGLRKDGNLTLGMSPNVSALSDFFPSLSEGNVIEWCPAARGIVEEIARRLHHVPGAALLIDYGYGVPSGQPTLQAVKNHRSVDVLTEPGGVDISAHVDFSALSALGKAQGLAVHGPINQGVFLQRLGAEIRCQQLVAAAADKAESIRMGVTRLIDPEQMGSLFKVMAFTQAGAPLPSGFTD